MTNKVDKVREGGSKRSASSSPSRRSKRQRDNPVGSQKHRSKDKTTGKADPDDDKKHFRTEESDEKSKRRRKKDRKSRSSAESPEGSYSSDVSQVQTKGNRYYGGDIEEGELSNHSQHLDYKIGNRYYHPEVKEKETVVETKEKESEVDYVVGKRYYDDAPEITVKQEEPASDNPKKFQSASGPTRRSKLDDPLLSRTGGAYIPPAKLRLMQASITDKTSVSYQRIAWEALKKSIHGHINKVNTSNIGIIARLLMKENIVRGRGLLCRSILQAQAASPTFTNVYSCLVSVINSKFPNIGELLMKRVILQFKRGFKRNDKALCISSCQFIAHLVNQQVAHEIIALEMLTLLLESPTDDSVEVAVAFLKEVGQKLLELSPKGTNAIFDMLRNILHQGNLEKRVQYMIEVVFQVRKDGFRSFESVDESLDLVEEEDRYTHILTLDEAVDPEDMLNVFKHDLDYELNEDKYKTLKEEIIGGSSSQEESGGDESDDSGGEESSDDDDDDDDAHQEKKDAVTIIDETETNLVALRRTIYLTIQSSLDFEECCHKLLKMDIKPGQEAELCHMLLDCCAELRTYEKFFGLLAQRFCQINRVYITPLEEMFAGSYATVHRLDTNKLRNVARFFGHLLFTDAISWQVLETVRLNEEDTTSSSRIFIKILFQELAEYMGLAVLNQRLKDPTLQTAMEGLFPRDNPKNSRFAINFFTSIGLGGLTDELREHLKTQPKPSAVAQLVDKLDISSDSSSSSASSSSSTSSSSSESESDSSDLTDSDSHTRNRNKNKQKQKKIKIGNKKINEQKDRRQSHMGGKDVTQTEDTSRKNRRRSIEMTKSLKDGRSEDKFQKNDEKYRLKEKDRESNRRERNNEISRNRGDRNDKSREHRRESDKSRDTNDRGDNKFDKSKDKGKPRDNKDQTENKRENRRDRDKSEDKEVQACNDREKRRAVEKGKKDQEEHKRENKSVSYKSQDKNRYDKGSVQRDHDKVRDKRNNAECVKKSTRHCSRKDDGGRDLDKENRRGYNSRGRGHGGEHRQAPEEKRHRSADRSDKHSDRQAKH